LTAENDYAEDWLAPLADLRNTIFAEIKSRTQETDLSVPSRMRGWWYYSRTVEGLDYAIHCRQPAVGDEPPVIEPGPPGPGETVLLDENAEAAGGDYFSVGAFDLSPDQHLLAWSADRDGSELHRLRIRDLRTGADLDDVLADTYYGTAGPHGRHLFYVRTDDAMHPYRIWRTSGHGPATDVVVVQEDDSAPPGRRLTRSEGGSSSAPATTQPASPVIPADRPLTPRLVSAAPTGTVRGRPLAGQLRHPHRPRRRGLPRGPAPIDDPGRGAWVDLVVTNPGAS
jgi:oligopeptidase B